MKPSVDEVFGTDAFKTPEAIVMQRSELQRTADCPRQGNLHDKHQDEVGETHDILPEAGKQVHAIAKEAIETCEMNLQEAADHIDNELPKCRPDLQPEVLRAGKNLANELRRFGGNQILLYEEPITRSVMPAAADRGEVLIVTEPDLVLASRDPEALMALDYKTGHKQRTNQEAHDDFQTCVICWDLFGKYPTVNIIHFFYINTRTFTRSYARIERDKDEENFGARILEAVRLKMEAADEAWPEPGKCAQCDVVRWCDEAMPDVKEMDGDPGAYLESYIVRQARCDEMLKALKARVKGGGVIYGKKTRFAWEPKPRFSPKVIETKDDDEQ